MADEPEQDRKKITRRNFTRGVALVAATTVATPVTGAAASEPIEDVTAQTPIEIDAQFQAVLKKSGGKLTEEEKADVKRLLAQSQKTSEALRGFPLDNSDEPATVFRVYKGRKSDMSSASNRTTRRTK